MKRIRTSIGVSKINEGKVRDFKVEIIKIDYSRKFYLFDIIPVPKPRMTRSDKWKKRPIVMSYRAFKDSFRLICNQLQYKMEMPYEAIYFIPMPDSWSEKKKKKYLGMPHEVRPDVDNIDKAVFDSLGVDDSFIWWSDSQKRWAYHGSILIYK